MEENKKVEEAKVDSPADASKKKTLMLGVVVIVVLMIGLLAFLAMNKSNDGNNEITPEETEREASNDAVFTDEIEDPTEFVEVETDKVLEKVTIGLTYDEVVEILGGEGRVVRRFKAGETIVKTSEWKNVNPEGKSLRVTFSDDVVNQVEER